MSDSYRRNEKLRRWLKMFQVVQRFKKHFPGCVEIDEFNNLKK